MSKNCIDCNTLFNDKKYTSCFSCRNSKVPEGKKKCTKCSKLLDKDHPKQTCPECLDKNRTKYAALNPRCQFIDEFNIKCSLGKKGDTYCEKHEKIMKLNGVIPETETEPIVKKTIKKTEISDEEINKCLTMIEKSRKITDEQIKKILEHKASGLNIATICKMMDLKKNMVSDVFHGRTKILSEITKDDIIDLIKTNNDKKIALEEKKQTLDDNSFKQSVFEDHGKKMRKIPVDVMIKIMMMKKEKVIAAKTKMSRYIFPNEIIKKLDNPNINVETIKNLWAGKTKMYPSDFEDADLTYDEYIELLNMTRT